VNVPPENAPDWGATTRYMRGDWPRNQGSCNWDAGVEPKRALMLRRGLRADASWYWDAGVGPTRLDTETRASGRRALILRRGRRADAPWFWDAGVGPSRLDAEARASGRRALMLRRGLWAFTSGCWDSASKWLCLLVIFRQPTIRI